ncbi:MAG: hypothetical protein JXM69_21290 [Anaerolineae bacterium]|nr:hypothetical protein [Anaerolineae bacterium]
MFVGTEHCSVPPTKLGTNFAQNCTEIYETGVKVPDEQRDVLNIEYHDVCPQWNYTIRPRSGTTRFVPGPIRD